MLRISVLITLYAAVSCTSKIEPAEIGSSVDLQAISDMSSARAAAFNESNADGIAKHFAEDAVLMAPGKPSATGKDAVRAYYQSIFDEYEPELDSHYEEVEVSGDLAYGRGFATVRLTPKAGGEPLASTAKYLNILKRQPDGTWKTTHDIWNGNKPTN